MFQSWRMQLRRAEAAWQADRLDEAGGLLVAEKLWEFLPAQRLTGEVVVAFLDRGHANVAAGNLSSAWHDLETAIQLAGESATAIELRKRLIDATLDQIDRYLAAEDAPAAKRQIDELVSHRCDTPRLQIAGQVARRMLAAGRLLRQGRFADADAELSAAQRLRPDLRVLENRVDQCKVQLTASAKLVTQVNAAVASRDWLAALSACDQMLAMAPDDRSVQKIRQRAARHVATDPLISKVVPSAAAAKAMDRPNAPLYASGCAPAQNPAIQPRHAVNFMDTPSAMNFATARSTRGSRAAKPRLDPRLGDRLYGRSPEQAMNHEAGPRLLAWADAVGGYLICLGDQIILGQATTEGAADVPILADLSRRHAVIRRDGESYAIVPLQRTLLDGRELLGPAPVAHGNLIELGGVKFRFERPHPLSATAVLQFVTHHKTRPKVDAIVLMAQTCVFGPTSASHIVCRNLENDLILYRDGKNFGCRAKGVLEIDGTRHPQRGTVEPTSRIAYGEFTLSLEPLESRAAGAGQS